MSCMLFLFGSGTLEVGFNKAAASLSLDKPWHVEAAHFDGLQAAVLLKLPELGWPGQ